MLISPDELLAIPIIWTPNLQGEELQHEVEKMMQRSRMVADFLQGRCSLEDYLDCLNDQKIAVEFCVEDWLEGHSYI